MLAAIAIAIVAFVYWRHRGTSQAASPVASTARSATGPQGTGERVRDESIPMPIFADDDPPGDLRLEGQVLDAADHPVGGATVGLGSNPPRTTTTEADGSFAFDKLVGRTYRLVARAPAGVAGPVNARLTAKSEPVVLRLRSGAKLAVTVVGTDGKPIDTASIELRGADLQSATTVHGTVTFAPVVPGFYEVVAWADGMAHATQRMRIAGDAKVRVMLASGAPVSGRVVDEGGAPIANARVVSVGSGDFRGQVDPRRDAVLTNKDGNFKFNALPSGSVRFLAQHDEHASGMSSLVTLDGKTEKSGVMVTLPAGAEVRGRVVDTNDAPVAGARVEIAAMRGRGRRGGGGPPQGVPQPPRQAYTDTTGEFAIKGLPRGELLATASHEIGAATGVPVDTSGGSASNVVLRLDLTATIAGVVVDDSNLPVEGAQVSATQRMDGGNFDPSQFRNRRDTSALTDAEGHFKITGLSQGQFSVRASRNAQQGFGGFGGRRGRRGSDGVDANAGDQNVHIVLPAEGGVKGKVAFTDGTTPVAFTITAGTSEQSFTGSSEFELDAIAPGDFEVRVRGPSFDSAAVPITVQPGRIADVGTITVAKGRQLAGVVMSNGQPVANATVYAGNQVMGGGSTNDAPVGNGMFGASTKTDTTAPDGTFSLAGFSGGDLTIVADLAGVGRSTPMRVTDDAAAPTNLVLQLQPYGSISGTLHQDSTAAGVGVTAQSTSTPGAVYIVQAGADGMYSFDHLAPDTYKVSATLGSPRRGMHFYSKQVDVPPSTNVTVDLSVDTGSITVVVTPTPTGGTVGVVLGWLANATLTATTDQALSLQLAAAGAGNSQMAIGRSGPVTFSDMASGAYTVCLVTLPLEVTGQQAVGYLGRHASALPSVCKPVTVADSPASQTVAVQVTVPAMIPDPQIPTGSGGP